MSDEEATEDGAGEEDYDASFNFYLNFVKPLLLELPSAKDKAMAASWIQRLEADPESDQERRLRVDYVKLLLWVMQRGRLIGLFRKEPPGKEALDPFPRGFGLPEMGNLLLEQADLPGGGDSDEEPKGLSYTVEISNDLKEFVAAQEVPNFGIQMYYAWSVDNPIHKWSLFDERKFPQYVRDKIKQLKVVNSEEKTDASGSAPRDNFDSKRICDSNAYDQTKLIVKSPQEIEKAQERRLSSFEQKTSGTSTPGKDDLGSRRSRSSRKLSSSGSPVLKMDPCSGISRICGSMLKGDDADKDCSSREEMQESSIIGGGGGSCGGMRQSSGLSRCMSSGPPKKSARPELSPPGCRHDHVSPKKQAEREIDQSTKHLQKCVDAREHESSYMNDSSCMAGSSQRNGTRYGGDMYSDGGSVCGDSIPAEKPTCPRGYGMGSGVQQQFPMKQKSKCPQQTSLPSQASPAQGGFCQSTRQMSKKSLPDESLKKCACPPPQKTQSSGPVSIDCSCVCSKKEHKSSRDTCSKRKSQKNGCDRMQRSGLPDGSFTGKSCGGEQAISRSCPKPKSTCPDFSMDRRRQPEADYPMMDDGMKCDRKGVAQMEMSSDLNEDCTCGEERRKQQLENLTKIGSRKSGGQVDSCGQDIPQQCNNTCSKSSGRKDQPKRQIQQELPPSPSYGPCLTNACGTDMDTIPTPCSKMRSRTPANQGNQNPTSQDTMNDLKKKMEMNRERCATAGQKTQQSTTQQGFCSQDRTRKSFQQDSRGGTRTCPNDYSINASSCPRRPQGGQQQQETDYSMICGGSTARGERSYPENRCETEVESFSKYSRMPQQQECYRNETPSKRQTPCMREMFSCPKETSEKMSKMSSYNTCSEAYDVKDECTEEGGDEQWSMSDDNQDCDDQDGACNDMADDGQNENQCDDICGGSSYSSDNGGLGGMYQCNDDLDTTEYMKLPTNISPCMDQSPTSRTPTRSTFPQTTAPPPTPCPPSGYNSYMSTPRQTTTAKNDTCKRDTKSSSNRRGMSIDPTDFPATPCNDQSFSSSACSRSPGVPNRRRMHVDPADFPTPPCPDQQQFNTPSSRSPEIPNRRRMPVDPADFPTPPCPDLQQFSTPSSRSPSIPNRRRMPVDPADFPTPPCPDLQQFSTPSSGSPGIPNRRRMPVDPADFPTPPCPDQQQFSTPSSGSPGIPNRRRMPVDPADFPTPPCPDQQQFSTPSSRSPGIPNRRRMPVDPADFPTPPCPDQQQFSTPSSGSPGIPNRRRMPVDPADFPTPPCPDQQQFSTPSSRSPGIPNRRRMPVDPADFPTPPQNEGTRCTRRTYTSSATGQQSGLPCTGMFNDASTLGQGGVSRPRYNTYQGEMEDDQSGYNYCAGKMQEAMKEFGITGRKRITQEKSCSRAQRYKTGGDDQCEEQDTSTCAAAGNLGPEPEELPKWSEHPVCPRRRKKNQDMTAGFMEGGAPGDDNQAFQSRQQKGAEDINKIISWQYGSAAGRVGGANRGAQSGSLGPEAEDIPMWNDQSSACPRRRKKVSDMGMCQQQASEVSEASFGGNRYESQQCGKDGYERFRSKMSDYSGMDSQVCSKGRMRQEQTEEPSNWGNQTECTRAGR